jgi:hypothetical protein
LSQPINQLVRPGGTAVFRVLAVGNGTLRYQWRKDGADLPGQSSSNLTITGAQLSNNGAYTCVVTDNIGPATTAPAQLIILIDPVITLNPLSQPVVAGATVVLSVSVTNTATLPIGFRLRRNNVYLPVTTPGAFLLLTQRTAYFTLTGTNAAPPWTNFAIVATNFARPGGILSASAILSYRTDGDGDGLPDDWEQTFFGDPAAADRDADSDGDGMLNWQEYVAGTDPANGQSYLKIDWSTEGAGATLAFGAISNRTYSIQYIDALGPGVWSRLGDVVAQPTNRQETISDPGYTGARFYRLVTPQQP